jgi:hypothetical protein
MTENQISKLMYGIIILGLSITASGLFLVLFTEKVSSGNVDDIMQIALLIALGLLISIPAKIYLTFQLMKLKSKKLEDS